MPLENPTPPWLPPAGVTAHNGTAIEPNQVFFCAPPPEIGALLTAYSTLKTGQHPRLWLRVLLSSLFALPFVFPAALIRFGGDESDQSTAGVLLAIGVVFFAVAFACLGFKRMCSYTGTHGVVSFRLEKSLDAKPIPKMLLFSQAANLCTGSTRHYYNGMYTGTSYYFTWYGADGKIALNLKGRYQSKTGNPKVKDPYWFARAAEFAWSDHKLVWLQEQLTARGYVPFIYGGKNEVRIGPGFFEFVVNGHANRIAVEEIKLVQLKGGQFNIQHKDAKWFSGKGKYSFAYGSVTNARLFLYTMTKLTGYKFG